MVEKIVFITVLVVILGLLGYVNYRTVIMRGKQLYCAVNCKEDDQCDFLKKGILNPLAVEAMAEVGFDISKNQVDSVFEFYKSHKLYSYVITVCDESSGQKCPIFPGVREMIHWSFDDPSSFEGIPEERLAKTRIVRDQIKDHVLISYRLYYGKLCNKSSLG